MTFLLLLAGLLLVIIGSDFLVDGASAIARKVGLSEFVIGLTIVGIGTSTPEMVVSFSGALKGISDISVGNIVGSNIFNVLLILGITALIRPVPMTRSNVNMDSLLNIAVSILLIAFGYGFSISRLLGTESSTSFIFGHENMLTRFAGVVFLLLFGFYMIKSFKTGRSNLQQEDSSGQDETLQKGKSLFVSILMVLGGLAFLIFGGNLFVDNAVNIARQCGVSDKFIAVTLLAGGTSMPELVTCIVAAAKNKSQLALGNILGSNISNILLILGGSALIHPLSFSGMTAVDICVLLTGSILIWLSAFTGKRNSIDRTDGAILLACEAAYMTYLIIKL